MLECIMFEYFVSFAHVTQLQNWLDICASIQVDALSVACRCLDGFINASDTATYHHVMQKNLDTTQGVSEFDENHDMIQQERSVALFSSFVTSL
mmetsp:Transcript_11809/g.18002  ORF Transcript_11809/g.18002 Transcript_11809/m.18002 type:complete len:94 (+) Transcript_11809:461-742(+)